MLIIALPLSPKAELTYVYSVDGLNVQSSGQCAAQQLPRVGGEVVAVVPWQKLSWHTVTLPPVTAQRRLAAVQGLLEDQVLQDVESLHWVTAPTITAGQTCVLACDKAWLKAALAPLEETGWVVQRIVPEFSPSDPARPTLYGMGSVDQPELVACLPRAVVNFPPSALTAFASQWSSGLDTFAEPSLLALVRDLTGQEPVLQTGPQRWLQASHTQWDLAQGEWAQTRHRRTWRSGLQAWQQLRHAPAWRPARWALAFTVVAQLIGLQIWTFQAQQHSTQLAEASHQILRQTFPSIQLVVDPLQQMNQAVNQLRQQSGAVSPNDFDMMLVQMAPLLPAGVLPQAVRYDGRTLTVQGVRMDSPPAQALEQLRRQGYQLRSQGSDWLLTWEARP
jgi:general secretion pathway protein L